MTQTIEQLQAKVAELEAENARLKAESRDACLGLNEYYGRKLAAEQLNNKRLREALKMVTNKVCWSVFTDSEETHIEEALSTLTDAATPR